jgi:hypothetical protein
VATYAVIIARETRNVRRAAGPIVLGLVLMLPVAIHVVLTFRPTTPAAWATAQDVLMNVRLQHHALVHRWLGAPAYAQLAIVCAGLWVVRRSPRLFAVLAASTVVAVALTIVQVLSHSASLALLFPWRLSVYVVPVSASVLAAAVVSWVHDRYGETAQRARYTALAGAAIIDAGHGLRRAGEGFWRDVSYPAGDRAISPVHGRPNLRGSEVDPVQGRGVGRVVRPIRDRVESFPPERSRPGVSGCGGCGGPVPRDPRDAPSDAGRRQLSPAATRI